MFQLVLCPQKADEIIYETNSYIKTSHIKQNTPLINAVNPRPIFLCLICQRAL